MLVAQNIAVNDDSDDLTNWEREEMLKNNLFSQSLITTFDICL